MSVKSTKKVAAKKVTKVTEEKVTPKKVVPVKKTGGIVIPVYSLLGKETGTLALPKEIFGAKVNKGLISQAIRVYTANLKPMTASTKNRGEVHGTTAKMYRQKGTGRARHGANTAPLFVGGGVAFGPRPRIANLTLPQKMRKAALISALSDKHQQGHVVSVTGLDKATGKTKEMANFLNKLNTKSALIIVDTQMNVAKRGTNNLQNVNFLPVTGLNAYEVLKHYTLVITKEAVEKLGEKK
ncbi:MAG: 50S ribosomal protein L4 [Candidatus Daviesbacteria bacterium]|nr:50S ribosomal protein L4 [Candidatus Daviesbacteria bacterium]